MIICIRDYAWCTRLQCTECQKTFERCDLPDDETYDSELLAFIDSVLEEHACEA